MSFVPGYVARTSIFILVCVFGVFSLIYLWDIRRILKELQESEGQTT